jgi:hypothetical protein
MTAIEATLKIRELNAADGSRKPAGLSSMAIGKTGRKQTNNNASPTMNPPLQAAPYEPD